MKEKNENQTNTCQTSGCKCSVNQIWLGIAVIIVIMTAAVIFGN